MKLQLLSLAAFFCFSAGAQNVGVGNTNPHTKLEVTGAISSTPVTAPAAASISIPNNVSIFRLSAVSGTQANVLSMALPQEGQYLTIYNEDNDTATFAGYTIAASGGVSVLEYINTGWRLVSSNKQNTTAWQLAGNSGTIPGSSFIGTTDYQNLMFKINNTQAGLIGNNGNSFLGLNSGLANTTGFSNVAIGTAALYSNGAAGNLVAIGDSALYSNQGNFATSVGICNTAVGSKALFANTTGFSNTAVGSVALYSNNTGFENTAIGRNSMRSNNAGSYNAALGQNSLTSNTSGNDNTSIGHGSLFDNSQGSDNTAVGFQAMVNNTSGSGNVAVGSDALALNSTISNLVAVGNSALYSNTTGTNNTGVGYYALYENSTGSNNTALGAAALLFTTGAQNTAVGSDAMNINGSGSNNVAVGFAALDENQAGGANIAIGAQALDYNINGNFNTAVGHNALLRDTASGNTAIGAFALINNVGGVNNVAVGYNAQSTNTSGNWNSSLGYQTLQNNTTGYANVAVGNIALIVNTSGFWNNAIGASALVSNTGGNNNNSFGTNSMFSNDVGAYNCAFGSSSLATNTSGGFNVAIGAGALQRANTANSNVAVGINALNTDISISNLVAIGDSALYSDNAGTFNTAVGSKGLFSNTNGSANTAIGFQTLYTNTVGTSNTAVGGQAMVLNLSGNSNTALGQTALALNSTGSDNTSIGAQSLYSNTSGTGNVATGMNALLANTAGSQNTFIGDSAGLKVTTGSLNTGLGYNAGPGTGSGALTNTTTVGAYATVTRSNSVILGNAANVGIGLTAPTQVLDIAGVNLAPATSGTVATSIIRVENTTGNGNVLDIGNQPSSPWGSWIQCADRTTLGVPYPLALNPTGGNVGIGTSTPFSKATISVLTTNTISTLDATNTAGLTVAGSDALVRLQMGIGNNTVGPFGSWIQSSFDNSSSSHGTEPLMLNPLGGFVGIGTSSPNAPLHIGTAGSTGIITASLSRAYFYSGSGTLGFTAATNPSGNIMVQADGWYWANGGGFVATSDARIKSIKGITNTSTDLQTLSQIEVTDYKYIDLVANGNRSQKKVIAQQVKSIYPQAISQMEGIIPSVYDTARSMQVAGVSTTIETVKPHGFKTGDEVKLIGEETGEKLMHVSVINDHTFSVADTIHERIFVYGKKIKDLLTVDYDAISMLNVSATQELYKLLMVEKMRNQMLSEKVSTLQNQNLATQSDVNILKASVETLQQILGCRTEK